MVDSVTSSHLTITGGVPDVRMVEGLYTESLTGCISDFKTDGETIDLFMEMIDSRNIGASC